MKRTDSTKVYTNSLFRKITYIYAAILLVMAFFVCYMAYSKEHNTMVNQLDRNMTDLNHEYESITEDFWRLYMPFWSNKDRVYSAVEKYFKDENGGKLSPIERRDLADALQIIMSGDDRMKWIGVYLGKDKTNYLLVQNGSALIEMTDDFPFIERLENKKPGMEIYESEWVTLSGEEIRCFALCGGTALNMGDGKIIMGYESEELASDYESIANLLEADYYIVNDFGIIYDSTGAYTLDWLAEVPSAESIIQNADGERLYVHELSKDSKAYKVFCVMSWWDMLVQSNIFTPYIILMVMVFWAFSVLLYRATGSVILRKIDAIQFGLGKIAANDLEYRIPVSAKPADEFEIISQSVNDVAGRLQENINKAYLSKLRQKEAELSELQAKFDPHFLYNTLEVIRGKVYDNGDNETADIIVKLAAIFRSFIGSENFISIQEELEFCNLYLSLLKYRYDNEVKIVYDIDSNILNYGIIRNLLQPLLENYFVHGFSSQKQDNRLSIRGKMKDEGHICFIIKDNGLGITDERLDTLKNNLDAVETGTKHGYGLKNVNRRIKLFYGQECGLNIDRNQDGGATIEILIRKLTCEEHKEKMSIEE